SNHGGGFSSDEGDSTKSTGLCDIISESTPTSVPLGFVSPVRHQVESQRVRSISTSADKDKEYSFDSVNSQVDEAAKTATNAF
ncbi:hypothetical protein MKW92_016738, partial [Papaver armeniacum]